MPTDVQVTLESLAGKVAERLVARALQQLASGAAPMTITVCADTPTAQKLLGPGRKKPGPKPGTRRPKKFQPPTAVAERLRKAADKLKAAAGTNIAARQCRKCFKAGTAQPLGDGRAKCASCGHTWTLRRSKFEVLSPVAPKRPTAKAEPGCCTRCDHPLSAHVEFAGKCLTPRCGCGEAVA